MLDKNQKKPTKVYVVTFMWYYGEDYGLDTNVYDSYDKALEVFLQTVDEEMHDSWIEGYLTDEGKIDEDYCVVETNLDLKKKEERGLYWAVKIPEQYKVDELQLSIFELKQKEEN